MSTAASSPVSSPWFEALPYNASIDYLSDRGGPEIGGPGESDGSGISADVLKELVKLLSDAERVDAAFDILDSITVMSNQVPPPDAVKVVLSAVESARELERARELIKNIIGVLDPEKDSHYAGKSRSAFISLPLFLNFNLLHFIYSD